MARRDLKQSTTKVEYKFKPHPGEYKNAAAIGDFLREVRLLTYKIDVVEWRALRKLAWAGRRCERDACPEWVAWRG
jgi:hypothetical protein